MAGQHDLIVRNGTIADGSGKPLFTGDVAVTDGVIAEVGKVSGSGKEEIDAKGKLVTPGFVDIHTHYDGQVVWEDRLEPSSSHGVTTILMGNCGVGFAPCRKSDRDRLVSLMEGIEDIPEVVMTEGLDWNWETYPEYLDAVEARPHDMNVASMLPHACLRVYVMGDRAGNTQKATAADLSEFKRLSEEAMRAGALGFGTSRSIAHRDNTGVPCPTKDAAEEEYEAICAGMKAAGHGVMEEISDFSDLHRDFEMLRRLSAKFDIPVSFSLSQTVKDPYVWKDMLGRLEIARKDGLKMKAQVIGRPTGVHMGHELSFNPFTFYPTYKKLSKLPLEQKLAELRKPEVRAQILSEQPDETHVVAAMFTRMFDWTFTLGNPPNYEPDLDTSCAAIAKKQGTTPEAVAYDMMMQENGRAILFTTVANYYEGNLDNAMELVKSPDTLLGLADGGAHYGLICDAGYPTFMLSYWTRDRKRGEKISVEEVVRMLARDTAVAVGMNDRGLIARGHRGDLNVIDYDNLRLKMPRVTYDLPAGGKRLHQTATGYSNTIVGGIVTYRDGVHTGALPGKLVRGPQRATA